METNFHRLNLFDSSQGPACVLLLLVTGYIVDFFSPSHKHMNTPTAVYPRTYCMVCFADHLCLFFRFKPSISFLLGIHGNNWATMLQMLVIGQSILFTANVILSVSLYTQGHKKFLNPADVILYVFSMNWIFYCVFICASLVKCLAFKTRECRRTLHFKSC